jgi:hypothetical protein
MPQPEQVEELSQALRQTYTDAWQRIMDEQQALLEQWPALTRPARLERLRELQDLVAVLTATVDEQALLWVVTDLPAAFLYGAVQTAAGGPLAGLPLEGLARVAVDSYADLLEATNGVLDTTKQLVRTMAKQHVTDQLVRGQTATQTGRDLAEVLADRGITAVTYSNGARHGLADYADMLVRTKSAVAYNEGTFGMLTGAGVGYVEVFDGASCGWNGHRDPDTANGTIRTLAQAQAQPLSHPRCQRAFGGRPDITSMAAAERARPSTTPQQRVDQAQVEQSRELEVARRAAARAVSDRLDRQTQRLLADPANRIVSPGYARRVAARNAALDRQKRLAARQARLAARSRL